MCWQAMVVSQVADGKSLQAAAWYVNILAGKSVLLPHEASRTVPEHARGKIITIIRRGMILSFFRNDLILVVLCTNYSLLLGCCGPTVITTFLLHVPPADSGSSDPACLSGLTLAWRALLRVTCFAFHNLFAGQWGIQRSLVKTPFTNYPRMHTNFLVTSWSCAGKETS